jgi:hypothetical protein
MPAADYAHEHLLTDGVETLAFRRRGGAWTEGVQGKRVAATAADQQLAAGFGARPDDATFVLWAATLGGAAPSASDELRQADGTLWSIGASAAALIEGAVVKWRCLCRRQLGDDDAL